MVGVPRSKGCRICVQRRVKCDLTRPTCNNCKKGNRPCPGFDSDLKFQDEGERLRKHFAKKGNQENRAPPPALSDKYSSSSSGSEGSTPWLSDETIELVNSEVFTPHRSLLWTFAESDKEDTENGAKEELYASFRRDNLDFLESNEITRIDDILMSPSMAQEALLHQLHASLSPGTQSMILPSTMRNHGRWLAHLPSLTGMNHLVDTAVRAVSLAHLARLHNSDVFLNESRPFYGKAIRMLSHSLSDQVAGMSGETLSATILLSFYEMFASDSNESWIKHAGGAGALIKARGPARHRHGFDREIFMAFRHTVVIECFETDEPCFLAEPEWRQLSRDIHEDLRKHCQNETQEEFFDLNEDFYMEMLVLPAILHEAKHLEVVWKTRKDQFPTVQSFLDDLVQRGHRSRSGLKSFYAKLRLCLNKLGHDLTSLVSGDPVIPIFYNFPNIMSASTCTGYWTQLIILNFCLIELERANPGRIALYKVENRECGLEICRSASYLLTSSFLGPFFIIQGLRCCLLAFTNPVEREWVIDKLFEIGQTHMAMANHIPGFHPGDGMAHVRQTVKTWDGLPSLEDVRVST
jgi:hypothetical protein